MSLTESQLNRRDLPSDRTLLRRYVLDGDESAFAEIVQRHSGLVMSVCYRVTRQQSDADDAFQATFLTLAQRPAGIDNILSLAGWLYSVAWRTSVRVVRLRRRRMMEALPAEPASQDSDLLQTISEASDLAALDEELNELPQKYRDVLVMNYLAQQTSQQIADQLNESKGAVDGRLREAKRLLRVRLARRGVEVTALMIAATLAQTVVAAPALIVKTQGLASIVAGTSGGAAVYTAEELLKFKTLSSAGAAIMTTRITLAAATVCAMLVGGLSMSPLGAFSVGSGQETSLALETRADGTSEVSVGGGTVEGSPSDKTPEVSSGVEDTGQAAAGLAGGGVSAPGAGFGVAGDGLPGGMGSGMIGPGSMTGTGMAPVPAGGNLSFSRQLDRTAEMQMIQRLGTEQSPEMKFENEQPLSAVLGALSTQLGRPIVIDTRDPSRALAGASLDEILVRDVRIPPGTMSIAAVLDEILSRPQDVELTWFVRNGMVVVTTPEAAELPENLILHRYDISALRDLMPATSPRPAGLAGDAAGGFGSVADPLASNSGGGQAGSAFSGNVAAPGLSTGGGLAGNNDPPVAGLGAGGDMVSATELLRTPTMLDPWEASVLQAVVDLTSPPCRWVRTGDEIGTMVIVGNRLVVRQTRRGHQLVSEAIEQLAEAAQSRLPAPPTPGSGLMPSGN